MKQSKISGWAVTSAANPVGPGTLLIHHPCDQQKWVPLSTSYWKGEIEGLEQVDSSPFACVARGAVGAEGTRYYFKRFLSRDWRDRLKRLIRASRGERALLAGERIREMGFESPVPACLLEWKHCGVVRSSVLVTEEIAGAHDFYSCLMKPELGVADTMQKRRALIRAFAREVARWHSKGLHHSDMRLGNIMVQRKGDTFTFVWLDLEGARAFAELPHRRRAHNLMQVNMTRVGISLTDRARFWQTYRDTAGIPADEARAIAREVIAYTQKRWKARGRI